MSDTKPAAPIPKSPAERYSWVSSGSQCTKQIIDRTSSPASPSFARTQTASKNYFDHPPTSSTNNTSATSTSTEHAPAIPPLPRRSSYNYAHDAEEFKRIHASSSKVEETADDQHHNEAIITSPITEGSFKSKMHGRTKSWDYQDVKRLQHRGLMMTNAEEAKGIGKEGEGGAFGFSEKS